MDGDNRTLDEIFREIRELLKHAFTLPDDVRRTICRRIMFEWNPDENPTDVQRATQVFRYIRIIIRMLEEGRNVDVEDTEEPATSRHPWSEAQVPIFHSPEDTEDINSGFMDVDNRTLDEIFREIRELLKHAFRFSDNERRLICRRIMLRWHPDKNPNDVQRATQVFRYIRIIIRMLEEGRNVDVEDTEEPATSRHPWSEAQVPFFHSPADTEDINSGFMDVDNRTLDEIFREIRELLKHAFRLSDDERRRICRRIMFRWHPDKNPNDVQRATQVFRYIRIIIRMLEEGRNVDVEDTEFFNEFERFYRREQEYE
nr:uncharacterized protein LOC117689124 [Crassostrea gigas]